MKLPYLTFYIQDDQSQIPPAIIEGFKVVTSIHDPYPEGDLIIGDPEGRVLSEMALRPGTILLVSLTDKAETNPTVKPTNISPMIIMSIENNEKKSEELEALVGLASDEDFQTGSLGGQLTLHLKHIWYLLGDTSDKAWKEGTPISTIIKDIATNSNRGFKFKNTFISSTDDGTSGPCRYKLQQTESEFLRKNILPYSTISRQKAYAFVNERHEFYFKNFQDLYKKAAKLTLIPPLTDMLSHGDVLNIKATDKTQEIIQSFYYIGRHTEEQIPSISRKLYIEDSKSNVAFVAKMNYKAPTDDRLLLKTSLVKATPNFSSQRVPIRLFDDGIRLNITKNSKLNEFIEIVCITNMSVDEASVGDTINVKLFRGGTTPKSHWLNGKYLITGSEHYTMNGKAYSKLLLAMPSVKVPLVLNPTEYYQPNS